MRKAKAKGKARLELRPLSAADAQSLLDAIETSRESLKRRFRWPSSVVSPEQAAEFVAKVADAELRGEEKVRGAFLTKNGELVGVGALQRLKETPGLAEISFWVRSEKEDKKYAQEIGRALVELAFRAHAVKLYSRIDPANRAARQVLKKLRFKYEGRLRREKRLNNRWIDQECWGLLKEDL